MDFLNTLQTTRPTQLGQVVKKSSHSSEEDEEITSFQKSGETYGHRECSTDNLDRKFSINR